MSCSCRFARLRDVFAGLAATRWLTIVLVVVMLGNAVAVTAGASGAHQQYQAQAGEASLTDTQADEIAATTDGTLVVLDASSNGDFSEAPSIRTLPIRQSIAAVEEGENETNGSDSDAGTYTASVGTGAGDAGTYTASVGTGAGDAGTYTASVGTGAGDAGEYTVSVGTEEGDYGYITSVDTGTDQFNRSDNDDDGDDSSSEKDGERSGEDGDQACVDENNDGNCPGSGGDDDDGDDSSSEKDGDDSEEDGDEGEEDGDEGEEDGDQACVDENNDGDCPGSGGDDDDGDHRYEYDSDRTGGESETP